VRYLARRVYLAVMVVLACAMRAGLTGKRVAQLSTVLKVPLRTLERWRRWWLEEFVDTALWRGARASFLPPIPADSLPASLLARFSGDELSTRLVRCLRFLAPLSALREGR
jgi:hypothetical protein